MLATNNLDYNFSWVDIVHRLTWPEKHPRILTRRVLLCLAAVFLLAAACAVSTFNEVQKSLQGHVFKGMDLDISKVLSVFLCNFQCHMKIANCFLFPHKVWHMLGLGWCFRRALSFCITCQFKKPKKKVGQTYYRRHISSKRSKSWPLNTEVVK